MDSFNGKINKVSLYGMYDDPDIEMISNSFVFLKTQNKNFVSEVKQMFPFEYYLYLQRLKKKPEFAKTSLIYKRTKSGPLIFINDTYFAHSTKHYLDILVSQYEYEDKVPIEKYKQIASEKFAQNLRIMKARDHARFIYLEIQINHSLYPKPFKMVFELFSDTLPITCKNFVTLLYGDFVNQQKQKLAYKGTKIHRVQKDGFIQGGDVEHLDGKGGQSIYGPTFNDENFIVPHDRPGIIGMANKGVKHSNNSQFYITLCRLDYFDKKSIAFGKIIDGFKVLKIINNLPADNGKPDIDIVISDCGIYEYHQQNIMIFHEKKRYYNFIFDRLLFGIITKKSKDIIHYPKIQKLYLWISFILFRSVLLFIHIQKVPKNQILKVLICVGISENPQIATITLNI